MLLYSTVDNIKDDLLTEEPFFVRSCQFPRVKWGLKFSLRDERLCACACEIA